MKVASPEMLIEFLPAPANTAAAEQKIYDLLGNEYCPRWLDYGVKEGFYKSVLVEVDKQPTFVFWYHLDLQGGLVVNAVVGIRPVQMPAAAAAAAEKLGRQLGAKYVMHHTMRPGMVRQSLRFGYQAIGIALRKELK